MFWKRKQDDGDCVATMEKPEPVKVKNMSPKEKMEREIRLLKATECLNYRLCESYAGGNRLAIVELEPESNGKKRKYVVNIDILVHEKPAGAKICVMKSEDPDDVVGWINKHSNKHQH